MVWLERLLLSLPGVWSKLIFQKIFNFQCSEAASRQRQLKENQHSVMCRFELDIGPGTADATPESDSTLEQ
jgi:hypothetical protein